MTTRPLGITVLADFVLNEGVDGILCSLDTAGASAVALNPTVTARAAEGQGSWQPPSDAGSSPRLFDRPLWGKRSLWVRSASSYHPDASLYADCPYRPRPANDLTDAHGEAIGTFIDAALSNGLEVYFQVSGQSAPSMSDDDRPRLPDGRVPERMADTGCLASAAIRSYLRAYVKDLLQQYPQVTGFRPDWPEYPCYKLEEGFQDFSHHVKSWARERGFAFDEIRAEVQIFYDYLHGSLRNADLESLASPERGGFARLALLRGYAGVFEWLRLKAALSVDMLKFWRESIDEAGGCGKKLSANAFMPPLTLLTGFDFRAAAEFCDAASPKLYTMHWTVMVEFWGRRLLESNPGLDEGLLVAALANVFDLGDAAPGHCLDDFHYPEPDEPHPVSDTAQLRRVRQATLLAGSGMEITPIVHGYGPHHDFVRRFDLLASSAAEGAWINRYGYLSDDKLREVGRIWSAAS
ncbi:MAG: hypothetical protein VX733_13775 [Candidatus Latescibacterota bacterium]|nr:hypothetical protein [Candidatus Latescibacterota bacterium]